MYLLLYDFCLRKQGSHFLLICGSEWPEPEVFKRKQMLRPLARQQWWKRATCHPQRTSSYCVQDVIVSSGLCNGLGECKETKSFVQKTENTGLA